MQQITTKDFLISQPSFPEVSETDPFYLSLANRLYDKIYSEPAFENMPVGLAKKIALTLTDYLQDVVADAGIWRSFVLANRELYGFTLPFYQISENYIDFELNFEDIRFLVWYVIAMLWEEQRLINPFDDRLLKLSERSYDVLESIYEEAPVAEQFNMARGLEFTDPEDREKIYALGNWLFLHCYLMTPAFSLTLRELSYDLDPQDPDHVITLNKRLEEALINNTTGPLALFTPEWVYLVLTGNLPPQPAEQSGDAHKYYTLFTQATNGAEIAFFDSYEKLNDFFISALGWEKGEEHLSQVKGQHDYVLMVNKSKGMLMAVNVGKCIKCPDNPLYDPDYAYKHSFELFVERGRCPGDLLKMCIRKGWLPDAHYPGSDDFETIGKYGDFIARTYLQLYYRGD